MLEGLRVVFYSDGVIEREGADGAPLGLPGLQRAIASAPGTSAAVTARAIERAVVNASGEQLEDDAAVLVVKVA